MRRTTILVAATLALVIALAPATVAHKPITSKYTYHQDVFPVFEAKCSGCHAPNAVAPMSLLTYEDARPWARSIKDKVVTRSMPPWYVDKNIGVQGFKYDRSLTDDQIATLVAWVDAGAPRGNPGDMPPPRDFGDRDRWHIGEPDWIVSIPEPFVVPAEGANWWGNLLSESGLTEDRWIKAVETKPSPGAYRVVHHVATSMRWENEDGEEGGGFLNEYAMGKNGDIFPDGTGRLIKAGTQIRFNMHYASNGRETTDRTSVGLTFYPLGEEPKYELFSRGLGQNFDLDIPPGEDNVRHDGYHTFDKNVRLTGFQPHLHNRGKRQCLEAILPTGIVETLSCATWDFGWHIVYNYEDEVQPIYPAGTKLHVISYHDNTEAHRGNLDAANWAGGGSRTIDEMAFGWISWYDLSDDEYAAELGARKSTTNDE